MFWSLAVVVALSQVRRVYSGAEFVTWHGGFISDVGRLFSSTSPSNHLFRNRGTTPRVDEWDLNMTAAYLKKAPSESSRAGVELTVQEGRDSEIFGFSATAPNIGGADWLLHLGPTNVSYSRQSGTGLTVQGGIFASFIGYDGLYAKDNFNYTRPWTGDYTPYFMLGVNASYPVTPRLTATGFVLNGYWHLAHANDVPSVGGQLAYKATDRVTVKETVLYGPHQTDTALRYLALLSDSIVERKTGPVTAAFEYQIGTEGVATAGDPRRVVDGRAGAGEVGRSVDRGPSSCVPNSPGIATVAGSGRAQSVKAFTSTVEYRRPLGQRTGDREAGISRRRFARSRRRLFHRAGRAARRAEPHADAAPVRRRPDLHIRRNGPSSRSRHGCALHRHHDRVLRRSPWPYVAACERLE